MKILGHNGAGSGTNDIGPGSPRPLISNWEAKWQVACAIIAFQGLLLVFLQDSLRLQSPQFYPCPTFELSPCKTWSGLQLFRATKATHRAVSSTLTVSTTPPCHKPAQCPPRSAITTASAAQC